MIPFLWSLISLILPSLVVCACRREWRERAFVVFPLSLALSLGVLGGLSVLLDRWMSFGLARYLVVASGSTVLTWALMRKLGAASRVRAPLPRRALGVLAILALLASADLAIILARNGWSVDPGSTYFRPPLHSDNQRNFVVIEAIQRRQGSPYLARSEFAYPLFWHQLAGTIIFPFTSDRYSAVDGMTLATAVIAFFLIAWAALLIRPTWYRSPWPGLALAGLALSHADLYHWILSLWRQGHPGIEADWSLEPGFFRNFSIKLAALTSPQHVIFLGLLATFAALRCRRERLLGVVVGALGVVASPVLAAMGLTLWLAGEIITGKKHRGQIALDGIATVVLGFLVHLVTFGFTPLAVLARPGVSDLVVGVRSPHAWLGLPFALVASFGMLGALLTWRMARDGARMLPLLLGAVLFIYVLDETEIRRHFALVGSLLGAVALARMPRASFGRNGAVVTAVMALGAFFLNGYFLYCYTMKPSKLDPHLPWADYFAMNDTVKREFPGVAILAAADPWSIGLEMPLVMDVTSSFSLPAHAAIHSRITPEQHELLYQAWRGRNVLPYAERLGYRLVVWGPVEERTWGHRWRERFIDDEKPLALHGRVGLYVLRDGLKQHFDKIVTSESGRHL